MTLLGMIDLLKTLFLQGREYVLTGHLQSDRIEAEFGIYRGNSGGNLHISVEQVISSLKLERIKLFSKIDVPLEDEAGIENVCCDLNLKQRDDDIEALPNCYAEPSNLPALEKTSVYYVCGYVAHKEKLFTDSLVSHHDLPESKFTTMLSRGLLTHPPQILYDLALYFYSFFKLRSKKCCTKIFLQAFKEIYLSSGVELENIDSIIRRFVNCFFKGFTKRMCDNEKGKQPKVKRLRMSSQR